MQYATKPAYIHKALRDWHDTMHNDINLTMMRGTCSCFGAVSLHIMRSAATPFRSFSFFLQVKQKQQQQQQQQPSFYML